jgi:hypothetical protein
MKGNEKDCICAKVKDKHTKRCDAFRLSQFMLKVAGVISQGGKLINKKNK